MAMIHCKECGAEISKSAKVCPNCGKKQQHFSIVGFIIGFIFIIIGISMTFDAADNIINNATPATETSTPSSISTSVVTKENYDKIQKGMTKSDVESILGQPTSVSESETPRIRNNRIKSFSRLIFFKGYRCILC